MKEGARANSALRADRRRVGVVLHDLCERSVIIDGGRIVADGPTGESPDDADLLAAHDLELPHGFVMDYRR